MVPEAHDAVSHGFQPGGTFGIVYPLIGVLPAIDHQDQANGQAFNIGGGPENTMSLLELLVYLESELQIKIPLQWADWRPGDQPVFVCSLDKAKVRLGWQPQIEVAGGVKSLIAWVNDNKNCQE